MFLNRLNKSEKTAFIKLAFHAANIDNEFCDSEKKLLAAYCIEAQIDVDISKLKSIKNISSVLNEFKSQKSKNIVLLELLGLVYSDDKYLIQEKKLITEIAKHFKISNRDLAIFSQWAKLALSITCQGEVLIEV